MVIFGATGDLSRRKLLPALLRLKTLGMLPECFNIIGFSTRDLTDDGFAALARAALEEHSPLAKKNPEAVKWLMENSSFVSSSFDDETGYETLKEKLSASDKSSPCATGHVFYLATPPSFFPVIIEMLDQSGLAHTGGGGAAPRTTPKIIIEKPFGRDLATAKELNALVAKHFNEDQVFRIDHYLGKETVQNILYFRFANGIFEPNWNHRFIDHVQITVAETLGVEGRGKYYEEAGAMRDMVQNHVLQLLSLVAMEPPNSMDPTSVRDRKIDLFKSLRPIEKNETATETVRGQYEGYLSEKGVNKYSTTETFAALRVMIDNWRWSGVPFYLRTGKAMKRKVTEIAVAFKKVPHCMFTTCLTGTEDSNVLVLKIQPDEGITFGLNVKRPGTDDMMETVKMDFSYKESFDVDLPEAYERLIFDALVGDATLFPHSEGIEQTWAFVSRILDGWAGPKPAGLSAYPKGSWGPEESAEFLFKDGRRWREG